MTEPVPIKINAHKSVPKIVPVASRDLDFESNNSSSNSSNNLKVYLPSLQDFYKEMCVQVQTNVINILEEVLENIAKDKGLNLIDLKTDYLLPLKNLMEVNKDQLNNSNETSKKIRKVTSEEQCMARTQNGSQCSRKKQKNGDYCGSHLTSQPNGRCDQPLEQVNKPQKKRGRPPKKVTTVQDYPDISQKDLVSQNTYEEMLAAIDDSIQITPKQMATIAKKKQSSKADLQDLEVIVQEADKNEHQDEITQVNFRMLEVEGKPIIIDDDTNKIYEMPNVEEKEGTIDISDLQHIGNLEPNGNLVFL